MLIKLFIFCLFFIWFFTFAFILPRVGWELKKTAVIYDVVYSFITFLLFVIAWVITILKNSLN